ncbi:GMP reductase [Candidatus Avelusimicrobium luingense]|uniref:GMP reductase n=1 Tax=Candidatus Avelusimicrobium luingense TaxID=3416211 RepID=UPI003D0C7AD1
MTRLINDVQLDYCDVLFQPKRTTLNSRSEADILREYSFKWYPKTIKACGIIAANMATTGTFEMNDALEKFNAITCLHKHYTHEQIKAYFKKPHPLTFICTGLKDDKEKLFKLLSENPHIDKLCVDIANGYIPKLLGFVKELRAKFPNLLLMAGNVVTGDMTQDLILSGADIVKAGIGPGSVCLTRSQTGVGRPQLSTVLEVSDAAHGVGGMICADGGCTVPGDIAKAFGAGADFVMIGGMLAGSDEAAGELVERYVQTSWVDKESGDLTIELRRYKKFYGMSSKLAQQKHFGGMAKYRTTEGREKLIPYTGPVEHIIEDILGGLRSTMSYIGARRLKDIPRCTTFYTVNKQLNTVFENMKDID